MILDLIAEAKADGLPAKRACKVLGLSPRSVQRWKAPVQPLPSLATTPPAVTRPRPYNALTASEAAAVIALIRSPKHVDASCRELALALQAGPTPTYVSHVTIWQYERALNCNGPRGRQVSHGRTAPDTDWVNGPNQLWDWDGRPFGRLVNISLDMARHQRRVSSPWRPRVPSCAGLVSFQGT